MLFPWMALSRRGRAGPVEQRGFACGGFLGGDMREPGVEELARLARFGTAEAAHVVIAAATTDEEHTFVAQRREGAAEGDVFLGVETAEQ